MFVLVAVALLVHEEAKLTIVGVACRPCRPTQSLQGVALLQGHDIWGLNPDVLVALFDFVGTVLGIGLGKVMERSSL